MGLHTVHHERKNWKDILASKCTLFTGIDTSFVPIGRIVKGGIQTLMKYARTRANPYGITYEAICREVIGTKQRNQLRRLIGFRFTRHPSINLPEERLTAIEKHIDRRVRELLALPRAKKE